VIEDDADITMVAVAHTTGVEIEIQILSST